MMRAEMDPKKKASVLIVGADGSIGRGLASSFGEDGRIVWTTTRRPERLTAKRCLFLDLSEDVTGWPLPPDPIDTVFLCAGVTSIKRCELEPERTRRVNVVGTVALAERLGGAGAFVIFPSTNLVFDGESPLARPTDPVKPRTEYGRQKAQAEARLLSLRGGAAIARFGKVLDPAMPLFRSWIRDLRAAKAIHPFTDMMMAPITLAFAVSVLRAISDRRSTGIIQASATQDISYADAAGLIAGRLRAEKEKIEPISCGESGSLIPPEHTTLDGTRLGELGLYPPFPMDTLEQWLSHAPP